MCRLVEYLFPIRRLLFCPIDSVFDLQKIFSFMSSHFSIVDLRAWDVAAHFRKSFTVSLSRIFPTFSSSKFSVSNLMLRSLVCVNLTFVQGDNCGPICIRAHVDIQLELHHLLKMLSFLHWTLANWLSLCVSGTGVLRWVAFAWRLEIRGQCMSLGKWAEH